MVKRKKKARASARKRAVRNADAKGDSLAKRVFSLSLSGREKSFLARFLASYAVLFILLKILPLQFLNEFVAAVEARILSAAGFEVLLTSTTLLAGKAAFEIIIDCSGLIMVILFLSLLFATRIRLPPARLAGYLAFFLIFNIVRLAFTLAAGAAWGQDALESVHVGLWFVDAGLVFACWAKEYGLW